MYVYSLTSICWVKATLRGMLNQIISCMNQSMQYICEPVYVIAVDKEYEFFVIVHHINIILLMLWIFLFIHILCLAINWFITILCLYSLCEVKPLTCMLIINHTTVISAIFFISIHLNHNLLKYQTVHTKIHLTWCLILQCLLFVTIKIILKF